MSSLSSNEMQTVVFVLGNEEYGIDISRVKEIIKLPEVTALPGTSEYVLGIINLRGAIIPILNLRKRFGFVDSKGTEETRVIVVEVGSKRVGLIVDEVSEVVKVPCDQVVVADNIGIGIKSEFIMGVVKIDERLLILLNVDNIADGN